MPDIFNLEDELIREYMKKVEICSRRYFLLGGDNDDLFQEGMIGLLNAIRTFDESRDVSFNTYAEACINNRLRDTITLNRYREYLLIDENEEEYMPSDPDNNPETEYINNSSYKELLNVIYKNLSRYEKEVLKLYLKGVPHQEIAKLTNKPIDSVYNAVQRIKVKAKKALGQKS